MIPPRCCAPAAPCLSKAPARWSLLSSNVRCRLRCCVLQQHLRAGTDRKVAAQQRPPHLSDHQPPAGAPQPGAQPVAALGHKAVAGGAAAQAGIGHRRPAMRARRRARGQNAPAQCYRNTVKTGHHPTRATGALAHRQLERPQD